jgi:hypothetical protein
MAVKEHEASHSLRVGRNRIKIYHEHKRLYKFCNFREIAPTVKDFLLDKLKETNISLKEISNLDLNMISVNPMRRSMFGNFYLDVDGEILDKNGEIIAKFSDFNMKHVPLSGYDSHDKEEDKKRAEIQGKFGKDQYSKEHCIRTQAIDDILEEVGGTLTLTHDNKENIDKFIVRCLELTGWTSLEDNRIHSRILRLPPHFEVPE